MQQELTQAVITVATVAITGGVGLLVRKAGDMVRALQDLTAGFKAHQVSDDLKFDSHDKRLVRLESTRRGV